MANRQKQGTEQQGEQQQSAQQGTEQQGSQQTQAGGGGGAQMMQGGQRGQAGPMMQRGVGAPSLFAASPFELMRMSPFGLMRRFSEEMDRMFEGFGMGAAGGGLQQQGGFGQGFFAPQVEVLEREGQLVVRADLPGMTKDDVRVEVTDDGLLLEGERRYEHQENQGGVLRSERSYGTFRRLVPLPEGANPEDAQATFRNGVLEITMQAPQRQSRGRQIEIQIEGGATQQQGQAAQQPQQEQAQSAGNR